MSRRHPDSGARIIRSQWAAAKMTPNGLVFFRSPDEDGREVPWVLRQNRSPARIKRDRDKAMRGRKAARNNRKKG